jgi:hypothetical protein
MVVGGDCGHRRQAGDQQRRYQSETKHVHPPDCFICPLKLPHRDAMKNKRRVFFDLAPQAAAVMRQHSFPCSKIDY